MLVRDIRHRSLTPNPANHVYGCAYSGVSDEVHCVLPSASWLKCRYTIYGLTNTTADSQRRRISSPIYKEAAVVARHTICLTHSSK